MHFRWSFIFSTYGLYFLPGSNFAPLEEVKVPVSNSADFFQKSAPWRILEDFGGFWRIWGWLELKHCHDIDSLYPVHTDLACMWVASLKRTRSQYTWILYLLKWFCGRSTGDAGRACLSSAVCLWCPAKRSIQFRNEFIYILGTILHAVFMVFTRQLKLWHKKNYLEEWGNCGS